MVTLFSNMPAYPYIASRRTVIIGQSEGMMHIHDPSDSVIRHCPYQGLRKETCPIKGNDIPALCNEHSAVIHRLDKLEDNLGSSEERNTERKMILHRLGDVEKHVTDNDFATKSMVSDLGESLREDIKTLEVHVRKESKELRLEIEKSIADVKAEADRNVRDLKAENEKAHDEFDRRIIKLMLLLTALAGGASYVVQYLL